MFKNYLKIALRNINRYKGYSFLNVIGLVIGETILLSLLALLIAVFLVELLVPTFNTLSGKALSLDLSKNISTFFGLLGIVLITGIISGSYPALCLSSFESAGIFKAIAQFSSGRGGILKKILVVSQFFITITLIIFTSASYWQLHRLPGTFGAGFIYGRTTNQGDWHPKSTGRKGSWHCPVAFQGICLMGFDR